MRNSSSHAYTLSCPSKEEALALQGTIGFSFHFIYIYMSNSYIGVFENKIIDNLWWNIIPSCAEFGFIVFHYLFILYIHSRSIHLHIEVLKVLSSVLRVQVDIRINYKGFPLSSWETLNTEFFFNVVYSYSALRYEMAWRKRRTIHEHKDILLSKCLWTVYCFFEVSE